MPVIAPTYASVPAALGEQARQQPDAQAYTFIDYEVDPPGYSQSLTYSQVFQRVQVVAAELSACGSPGDRAAILAPQGLEYVVGVLGAMAAGFIAVPLSVPLLGVHDERVSAALKDSSPTAILTTSAVVSEVDPYARALPGSLPAVIEIDALDLYSPPAFHTSDEPQSKSAMLQYTSGSTRSPAGVVVTHKNIMTNLDQIMADYFEDQGGVPPQDATLVSWLPFFHDMGLMGRVGEIWVHGDNVAAGYWRNPQLSEQTFGARLVDPSAGTPQSPWLRTGDLGVISDGELFIVGRIKDVLIVDGRNHYPDDIEVTIGSITRGRVAAISIQNEGSEQLVVVAELKNRGNSDGEFLNRLQTVKREVTSAISKSYGLGLADLVTVSPGSIPITTSGKVRRSTCAELYRQGGFTRLDIPG